MPYREPVCLRCDRAKFQAQSHSSSSSATSSGAFWSFQEDYKRKASTPRIRPEAVVCPSARPTGAPATPVGANTLRWHALAAARSGKLYRARSRLYRGQSLQVNMRLKALAEIYTMHSFAQLCTLKILPKILPKIFANLANF